MFNWFRRNEKAKQPATPSETKPEVTTSQTTETEVAEPDYLAFAKAAYKNIQERKGEAEKTTEEVEAPTPEVEEPAVEDDVSESEVEEPLAELTETIEEEVEEPVVESTQVTEEVEETAVEAKPAKKVPAWMQKSQGLEKLKETAIKIPEEEPVVESTELDEDFIWSSQVLAKSGRTAEDISEEEISWLTKLRQGLGKTRIGLINQLKSIVGKGPLNDDAVMEIESLLLQADVGIEATDYIIETLQAKLKQEALPPDQAIAYLKTILQDILDKPLADKEDNAFVPEKNKFNIWLLTGVNGAGKTTTIGKLANLGQKSGYSCLIAAADTFRGCCGATG